LYDHPLYRTAAASDGGGGSSSSKLMLIPRVSSETNQDPVLDSYKAYAEFLKHRQHQLYWSEIVREDEASRPKYKPNWCAPCRSRSVLQRMPLICRAACAVC
jgi:hypothetical protein